MLHTYCNNRFNFKYSRNEVKYDHKTTKKIFSITQKLDETYWLDWTDEEIATLKSRTCSVDRVETREELKIGNRRNACNISRYDASKTCIGTITAQRNRL